MSNVESDWKWFAPYVGRTRRALLLGLGFLFATNALQLSIPWLTKRAIDSLAESGSASTQLFAYGIALIATVAAVVRFVSRVQLHGAGRHVEFQLRGTLFAHLAKLTPSFFGRTRIGDLMSRCLSDTAQVQLLVSPGVLTLANVAMAYAIGVPAMLGLDPWLTAAALLPGLPLLFLLRGQTQRVFDGMKRMQEELGVLSAQIQQNLAGQLSVKSFGRERSEVEAFSLANERYYVATRRLASQRASMMVLFDLVYLIGSVAVLGIGGVGLLKGRITLGGYAAFSGYLAELSARAALLGMFFATSQRGRAALARVREVVEEPPELVDPHPNEERALRGELDVQGLTVRYGERRVLDDVRFTLPSGGSLAVVGKTGAGKSTLLLALLRLIDVARGSIRYDGLDVCDWPLRALRRQIGWISQDPILFSMSLKRNIAFGRPEATDDVVAAAAQAARLVADLSTLPSGLETVVGERGVTLSGGQRSRTALARAYLVDPKVLLLDDPFANVDADTAQALWEGLGRDPHVTRILVTHQLAMAMRCDRIIVLEQGKIVEQGRHDELLARGGAYGRLFQREVIAHELGERHKELA